MLARTLALLVTLLATTAEAQPFTRVPTPNPGAERNLLRDVSGTSDQDLWAVGDAQVGAVVRHLIYRWNGETWTYMSAPFLSDTSNQLWGVSFLAPTLGFVAGIYSDFGTASGYIMRYEGDHWSIMHHQYGEPTTDIWAIGTYDVWAVGTTSDPRPTPALALHFDGNGWQRVDPPLVADRNHQLDCVHASSPDNVWAAGFMRYDTEVRLAYVVRWDGNSWHDVPLPVPTLTTVDVLTFAPDDTWVALDVGNVWHWDGDHWTEFPLGAGSLAGPAPNDIYAFGAQDIHHWDGQEWTLVQTMPELENPAFRNSAQVMADGSVWAVGREIEGADQFRTLAIHRPPATTAVPEIAVAAVSLGAAPNPFNPRTVVHFSLPSSTPVVLALHDLAGRRVRTLLAASMPAGAHAVAWDGTDDRGAPLPSGTYIARVIAGGATTTSKLTLVR